MINILLVEDCQADREFIKSSIKSALSSYSQIGSTVNWKLTTKDTVIVISNDTLNRYREYKVTYTLTGDSSVVGLKNQEFKQWIE